MSVCNHKWEESTKHEGYNLCLRCSTCKLIDPPDPAAIYTADYWSEERGHSSIDDQVYNIDTHEENGITKAQALLKHISGANRACALEIGCAPGIFLKRLRDDARYTVVHGIDVPAEWECDIRRISGYDAILHFGLFPKCTADHPGNKFDLIVAMDVFEHSPVPGPFLLECFRLLKLGGQLLMMAPLITGAYPIPERMFCPEHIWLHSIDNLAAMLGDVGFHSTVFDSWCPGHEIVSAIRGQWPDNSLRAA